MIWRIRTIFITFNFHIAEMDFHSILFVVSCTIKHYSLCHIYMKQRITILNKKISISRKRQSKPNLQFKFFFFLREVCINFPHYKFKTAVFQLFRVEVFIG